MHATQTKPRWTRPIVWAFLTCTLALAGCDELGLETPGKLAAKKEAEGRAIGSACRHAVRSIEDCYTTNPKAPKAAVFDGWKDMDAYMRENNIQGMPFVPPVSGPDEALVPKEEHNPDAKGSSDADSQDKGSGAKH